MKKLLTLGLLFFSALLLGQMPQNAPWSNPNTQTETRTLEEISAAAESYFNTIDKNKKGSGYKPFKRWQYNWSKFLKPDGKIAPKGDLFKAWEEKKLMTNSEADVSNWIALGPYDNSNTFNAIGGKRTGQGRVNKIAVDPNDSNTYYVGTPAGGIWKSTNAGLDWTPLTDELPQIGVSGIAIHPTNSNIIYIATGDDDAGDTFSVGVYKSEDGGATWNPTGSIPGNPNSMNEIYVNPDSPETVIVATSTGVMRSTNGGGVWNTVLNVNGVLDLKMKPNDPTTWYAVTNSTFYKSTNSGATFSTVNLPNLVNSRRLTMGVTSANNGYVYVVSAANVQGFPFNGLYKSTNSGSTFTRTNATTLFQGEEQAWYDFALAVSSNNPEIVYVGVVNLHKSTNGGNSFSRINHWNNPNQGSYTHADIHYLNFIDGKFFAGTDGGIYVSTDEAVNFTDLTKNLAISQFYRISVSPQNYNSVVGGLQDNGGFAYNNGTWKNYHGADGMEGLVDPSNPDKNYGFIQYGQQLHITENGGLSRTNVVGSPGGVLGEWITPLSINNNSELYSGFSQIYRLDNDNTWTQVSNHSFANGSRGLDVIEIDPNNNNNFLVANASTLYRSTDKGVTFETIPFSAGNINAIEFSNNDSNTVWIAAGSSIFKSTNALDASPTFTNISGNLPFGESKNTIKHHERSGNNTIYVGTSLGVYFINDDVSSWEAFDNNLPNTQVRDLAINEEDSKLIAATYGRGAFISDIPRQLPPNDIRLISIINPSTGINCNSNITPEITIKNQGTDPITSATINYNIDGGSNSTFNWTGNLASEENVNVTLPEITGVSLGAHTINIETVIANDAFENNIGSTHFSINQNSTAPLTANDFESTSDDLLVETNNTLMWERGRPNKILLEAPEGDAAYITGRINNYPDETIGYLYTNCYDLTAISNPELAFKMAFDIENEFDYLLVEYSVDFGVNWSVLGSASDPNWYNNAATQTSQGAALPGAQWTGLGETVNPNDGMTNATARDYSYDLAAFTNEANIVFRFKFFTDQNTNEEGAVIDNLVLNGVLSTDSFNLLNQIAIYPNPSESIFNINWTTGDALDIKVYDITGKQIFTKKNITDNNYQLDLGNYAQGIYLLNLNMNGKTATKKLILK